MKFPKETRKSTPHISFYDKTSLRLHSNRPKHTLIKHDNRLYILTYFRKAAADYRLLREAVENLRRCRTLEEQKRRTAVILAQIDCLFHAFHPEKDSFRREMLLQLRFSLHKHSQEQLFRETDIQLFRHIVESLNQERMTEEDVFKFLDALEDAGLSPLPVLE